MRSPYQDRPPQTFWRTGVADRTVHTIENLYRKRFPITRETRIVTAGSCFAQHITRNLKARGFNVLEAEPAPQRMDPAVAHAYGYDIYSARYGNIYTVRQLLQLHREAFGKFKPADAVWERDGQYFDAMRPGVEPHGLKSAETVTRHRIDHLARTRRIFKKAEVFIFTLGLTEAWVHAPSGTVYPTAPGTIAGSYDPDLHKFKNFTFREIFEDFVIFRSLMKQRSPDVKFLLTVSPVPLTATATDAHVLSATTYSKSVLRAVAGQLQQEFEDVDYFPSYELVASPFSRGKLYEPNLRSIRDDGVEAVMKIFFAEHDDQPRRKPAAPAAAAPAKAPPPGKPSAADVVCEEALLEAFS